MEFMQDDLTLNRSSVSFNLYSFNSWGTYIHNVFYEKYSKCAPNVLKDPILIYPHILISGPLGALWGPWGFPIPPDTPTHQTSMKKRNFWAIDK